MTEAELHTLSDLLAKLEQQLIAGKKAARLVYEAECNKINHAVLIKKSERLIALERFKMSL